jgi:predicted lipoprotein with Yx(FWY)xxD motif
MLPFRSPRALAPFAALIVVCGLSTSVVAAAAPTTGATPSTASAATLTVVKVPGYGSVLANSKGKAVYIFSADPKNGSKCTGSCIKTWIPVTVTGKPKAGANVKASLITTFKRKGGGGTQVAYDGHALYTYPASPLQGSGAGQASAGGVWYLIADTGKAVKKTKGGGY